MLTTRFSGGQDRYRGHAGSAVQMRVADRGLPWYLPGARGAAQLQDDLVDLAQARGADRLAIADQAAVGVDRQPAGDLGLAVGDHAFLFTVLAQPVLGEVDDLRPGVGVLQLSHRDVLRPDPGELVRLPRGVHSRARCG